LKMVPLANAIFSKMSSSLSPSSLAPSPSSNSAATCSANSGADGDGDDVRSSASSWHYLPAEPPPPYQLYVANPAPESECLEGVSVADVGHRPTTMSASRFTTASIEAVRAPDSPVPVFPSPKLSTDSVFGSTQSLASFSSENGTIPAPHYTRWNAAAAAAGPVLRRKDTIRFARRTTVSSPDHPRVLRPKHSHIPTLSTQIPRVEKDFHVSCRAKAKVGVRPGGTVTGRHVL
jgi:hypothetical protein